MRRPSLSTARRSAALVVALAVGCPGVPAGATEGPRRLTMTDWSVPGRVPSISADGRYVTYLATSQGRTQVYVWDRSTSRGELVSATTTGRPSAGTAGNATISADGRYVAFASSAPGLVAKDTNNKTDVFVRDRVTRRTVRVNLDVRGRQLPGRAMPAPGSITPAISANGRKVLFPSCDDVLLDGGTVPCTTAHPELGWYVTDRVSGRPVAVNRVPFEKTTFPAAFHGGSAALSADGRYVAFSTTAKLSSMDDDGSVASPDDDTFSDVYRRDLAGGPTTLMSNPLPPALEDSEAGQPPSPVDCPDNVVKCPDPNRDALEATVRPLRAETSSYDQGTLDATGRLITYRELRFARDRAIGARLVSVRLLDNVDRQYYVVHRHDDLPTYAGANPEALALPAVAGNGVDVFFVVPERNPTVLAADYTPPATDNVATLYRDSVPPGAGNASVPPAAVTTPATTCLPCVPNPAGTGTAITSFASTRDGDLVFLVTNLALESGDTNGRADLYVVPGHG